jgi:acetyl esterase/lipase
VEQVVAAYPVVDLASFYNNADPLLGLPGAAVDYLGGPPRDYPERYSAVTSSTYISAAAPPTLVIQGERDGTVPPQSVYDFVRKARAAATPVRLIRVPYGNHGFDLVAGSVGNQIFRQAAAEFLQSQR